MIEDNKDTQDVTIYEIENKKYTVITKYSKNVQSLDKLYNLVSKYIISQIKYENI